MTNASSRTRTQPTTLQDELDAIVTLLTLIKDTDGIKKITDCIDVCDRANRLVGIVYGSQGQQLLQRALTFDLLVQLRHLGVEVDPRARTWNLNFATDSVSTVPILGTMHDVNLMQVLGVAISPANPVIAGIYDALGNRMPAMDVALRPGYFDMIDRAARQVGIVYGDVGQLAQRAVSRDAYVQLRTAGAEYDARQIRALISTDVVGIVDAAGNRMPSMDAVARRGYQAITDGTETLSIDASNRAETAPVQTTRTNLTVKGEREDTSLVYNTFVAGGASDVAVLGAGGVGIKHKVYSCGYTIDAAVQAGFRFNSANPRFCVRRTAGVFAQTFTHPIVSATNVTLTLRVEGACNGDYWCQYISEA